MAIKNCVVLTCKNNSKDNPDLRFFSLTSKPELRKLWLRNIGNTELHKITENQLKCKLVCQDHFHESQYRTSERIKLNLDAVPTLNLPNILNYTGQTIEDHDYLKRSISSSFNDSTESFNYVKDRIYNTNVQINENKPIECDITDDCQVLVSICDDLSGNQKEKQKNFESSLQLDLNQCRTCLSKIHLKSIYNYADQLAECASIYVHATDEFPKKICKVCITKLKEISAFRKQCENSEQAFSLTLKHHKRHIDNNICLPMDTTEITDIGKQDCTINEFIIFENKTNVEDNINISIEQIENINNITENQDMKCHLCGKEFTIKSKYKYHMIAHNRQGEHLCHICGKRFTYMKALLIHTSIHKDINTVSCPICPERVFIQSQDLHKHMKIDHGKREKYICSFCGCKYNKKLNFQKHIQNKHNKLNEDCTNKELVSVEGKSIENENINVSKEQTENTINIIENQDTQFIHASGKLENLKNKCHLCGKEFTIKSKYKYHMIAHNRQGEHLCHICGKQFTNMNALQNHTSIHKVIKTISCPICPERVFVLSQDLHKHMKIDHGKREIYICSFCGCKYNKKLTLQKHIQNKHNKLHEDCTNKELVSVEGKSIENENINVSKEQTENTNNIIEDRDTKFIHASGKQENLKNKCHLCGKQFVWRSKYKRHMNTHNQNFCQICGRPFRSLKYLERHIKIHNEINMINCPVCPDRVFI